MRWLDQYKREISTDQPVSMMYAYVPGIRVCVHRIAGTAGWYLNCPELRIDAINLHTEDFKEASELAKLLIREKFGNLEVAVNNFLEN